MGDLIFRTTNSSHYQHVFITREGSKYGVGYYNRDSMWVIDLFDSYGEAFLCARSMIQKYAAGMSSKDSMYQELMKDMKALYSA